MASSDHVDGVESRKSKLCKEKVVNAVRALYKQHELQQQKKKSLFGSSDPINLQVTLWEVPIGKNKRYKLSVPHGVRSKASDICLITKDQKGMDREQCTRFYEQLLAKKGVKNISHVMSLQTLRKEYRPFEARRRLVMAYDLFLADERIFRLLDTCTGKEFHRKRKYPVAVNIMKTDLVQEINSSINAAYFTMVGRGACSGVMIANTGLTQEQTVENLMAGVESLTSKIPKGWPNIKCLYIKTEKSLAIPLYASMDYTGDLTEDAPVETDDEEVSEDDGIESGSEGSSYDESENKQKRKQITNKQTILKKIRTDEIKENESQKVVTPKKETKLKETSQKKGKKKVSKVKKSK